MDAPHYYIFTYIAVLLILVFLSETSDGTMAFIVMSVDVTVLVSTKLAALEDILPVSYIIENSYKLHYFLLSKGPK
jgi:hypothetical protein